MINNNMNQSEIKIKKNLRIANDSINNNYNVNSPRKNNYAYKIFFGILMGNIGITKLIKKIILLIQ